MSIATIHYLSMNLDKGYILGDLEITEDVSGDFTIFSLRPGVDYFIDWGDEESDVLTANDSGSIVTTHTYADAGQYQINVTNDENGSDKVVAFATVTVVVAIDTD